MESPNKLPLYRGKRPTQTTDLLLQSNARELSLSLKYLSSLNRFNVNSKVRARQYISDTFRSFGLNVTEQKFKAPYIENEGINIIGIRKGTARRKRSGRERLRSPPVNDQIVALVIGAHYDTVKNTSGLNDNGSGIGVMLEMGAIGSKYFVNEYLIPNELSNVQYRSHFKGAIIMDTLLNFDAQPGTQDIPNDIHLTVPGFSTAIKQSNYSGNFLAMFARTNIDQPISRLIEEKWSKHDSESAAQKSTTSEVVDWKQYQLKPVSIKSLSKGKAASFQDLQKHVNMLRSDHLHFWYHNHSSYPNSLGAVLLTDTGPFRGYMRYCYHKLCDDSRFLSEKNVNFVRKTVDVLMQVVMTITQGSCLAGEGTKARM
ncbi:hypothetical protein TYRP_021517 [Tyrophagus putrescentiae]|nr:hypothetical protein TYRP_021517 [Tyrophagus putrescentiae]